MRQLSLDFLKEPDGVLEEKGCCGIVAVVGRANTGKSTLLNRLLTEKVSIVSPVAQTTRNVIRAVLTEKRGQLVFLDTPGVHKARYELNKLMNKMARDTITGADVIMLVLDGSQAPLDEDEGWMRRICRGSAQAVFAVNKMDQKGNREEAYHRLWSEIISEKKSDLQPAWHRISAAKGDGIEPLLNHLFSLAPKSPFLFSPDVLTDFPRKLAIADLIREKFFYQLRDEIPHSLAVEVDTIEEQNGGWLVKVDIIVKRSGQKGIVIGPKGKLLKKARRLAEQELTDLYGLSIELNMWVKVDPKWDRNHWILKKLGYKE